MLPKLFYKPEALNFSLKLLSVLSKQLCLTAHRPNETFEVTRQPHYDADATMAVPEPYKIETASTSHFLQKVL